MSTALVVAVALEAQRALGSLAAAVGSLSEHGVTLTQQNLPSHTHPLPVLNAPGDQRTPSGNILAGDATNDTIYAAASRANAQLAPTQASGGGQPINVLDPSLVISIQVAIQGLFPSRT